MLRRFLLVVTLTTSAHLLGQNAPSGSTNTPMPVPGTGYVINGGYVTTAGNGQLVTPQAAYVTPAPTAGISNGDRAGITNNAPIQPSSLVPTPPQVVGVVETAPTVPATGPISASTNTTEANANPEESQGPVNDLGPSYFSNEPASASPEASLAEIAAQYHSKHDPTAHVYTNADIAQLRNQGTGIVLATKIAPPPAAAEDQQTAAQTTQPAPTTTVAQAQPPAPGPQQQAPPTSAPQSSTQPQQGNTGTTPQINQPSGTKEDTRRLPATSSLLPLLGLLGLASGGVGLWIQRRRA